MKEVAGGEHVPVLRFAIAGWVTLCAMAVGVAFFPIDSGRGAKPNSEIAPLFNVQSPLPELRSTSCSTSNCHGSLTEDPRESRIRSDEYHVWLNDPHARAFQVLTEERSRKIFQNLGVADQFMNPKKGQVDAFQRHWNNCLGCHDSNRHLGEFSHSASPVTLSEGVSCESCHGDSTLWLHRHYRSDWQESVSDATKTDLGFISGHELSSRISQCAACHVGNDHGEVNHDLIAAGHPALRFEFVWYQSRLPRHWKPGRDAAVAELQHRPQSLLSADPARSWLIGQLASSIVAVEQFQRRIEGKGFQSAIPELAEFNCFACHHDLRSTAWKGRTNSDGGNHRRSNIPWGNWNLVLIPTLADQFGSRNSVACAENIRQLQNKIEESLTRPTEVPGELKHLAEATRNSLRLWLNEVEQPSNQDLGLLAFQVSRDQPERLISSWEQTANLLLGLAARYRSSHDVPEPLRRAMETIRFSDLADSPEFFLSQDAVPSLTREQWIELLKELAELSPDGLSP